MRKRRIDAKTRVAIQAFLNEEVGAIETCQYLSPRLYWDKELLDDQERSFVDQVAGHTSATFVRKEWHPDLISSKLGEIVGYEKKVRGRVEQICHRILEEMQKRKKASKI